MSTTDKVSGLVADAAAILGALNPIVNVVDPAIGAALTLVQKIASGVAAAEPTAVGLYTMLTSATPPTEAQLTDYAAAYDAAFAKLNTDLQA